ncbi:MAG: hypothetical protein A2909_02110 [Candidatus Tagabacteria bacterium RIFCSPLOWO2_01_FULL_39_11]|uniref:Type II secretion system protein GspH n=1 Tax=Candidatus Tagabacteria bacterium RIFCSPLOWO2_01_FULL_39_11 TaxID=1802295 RepID=A0A1G2LMY9_9BACT|nr:MAG: hypothetical protein A2909_02110 [Candidatus Tagabacteria bacterium RIFCSPLOWO2_01_FULL_39_11]
MKKRGFTIIELLVVISVITIISAIILVSVSTLGIKTKVDVAVNLIFDAMKEARHNSVSIKEFNSNLFPSYGVYLDQTAPRRIIIYADCVVDDDNNNYIDDNDNFDYNQANCAGSNFVKQIDLDSQVAIKEMRTLSCVTGVCVTTVEQKIYLEYVRPEPLVWITRDDGFSRSLLEPGKIEIDLEDTSGKFQKKIIIWSTGQFATQ